MSVRAFCTACGAQRGESGRFCRSCGLEFGASDVRAVTVSADPDTAPSSGDAGTSAIAGPIPATPSERRVTEPTPMLDRLGRDLTSQAGKGRLGTIVGRDAEVELVIETLCRSQKRNPALVGPAGTGKTAIVEGLAQRIVAGTVPQVLGGARIVQLSPAMLVAGAGIVGELENRMKAILAEAAQDGILLFIDEFHSIVGAGGARGTGDIASLLKPALARGDIACIAATTDDEYRTFIEADKALERRFSPVRVHELEPAETLVVVAARRDDLFRLRGVRVSDDVLAWLVDFAARAMPNRRFPDKAIDLVEQCVANAVVHGRTEVSRSDAAEVVRRMVGIPVSASEMFAGLERDLLGRHLMTAQDARALVDRLSVTLRGLDARPARPNAVLLLLGESAMRAEELCDVLSTTVLGNPGRIVTLDLGHMGEAHDATLLIGAPPGYVGYDESLPIHEIAQMPWCIVRIDDADAAHPRIRALVAEALDAGYFANSAGRRIYLSDAIVVLVVTAATGTHPRLGFGVRDAGTPEAADTADIAVAAERFLGAELAAQVDVVVRAPSPTTDLRGWIEGVLLAGLRARMADHGIDVRWDATLVDWLAIHRTGLSDLRGWERLVDQKVGAQLAGLLGDDSVPGRPVVVRRVLVRVVDGRTDISEGPTTVS